VREKTGRMSSYSESRARARDRMQTAAREIEKLKGKIAELRNNKMSDKEKKAFSLQKLFQKSSTAFRDIPGKGSLQERCKVVRTLRGHFGKVYALHWGVTDISAPGAQSQNLISASQDGKLIVWNAYTKAKLHAIPLRSTWVMTCAYEPTKGTLVACGGLDNVCSVYKLAKPGNMLSARAQELNGHEGYLACCRFLDANTILTCSGDSTCYLWDIAKMKPMASFRDHTGDVMSVSTNPTDQNIFVSGSCDASAKVWDIRTKKCTQSFGESTLGDSSSGSSSNNLNLYAHNSDINSVDFLQNGKTFATGSDDSTARIFDMRSYSQLNMFYQMSRRSCLTSVAASKQGRLLFCGYDDYNCLAWDTLGNNEKWAELTGHGGRVSCVGLDTTGQALATGSWDTLIKVFA